VKNWFQSLPFKCNLYRYIVVAALRDAAEAQMAAAEAMRAAAAATRSAADATAAVQLLQTSIASGAADDAVTSGGAVQVVNSVLPSSSPPIA
jgi:hypothetical protein